MTFPLRPRPIPGEPACGYMLRLAEANGYGWLKSAFSDRGLSTSRLARGDTSALVPILGRAAVEELDRFSPRRTESGRYIMCGESLDPAQLYFERRCFCLGCWAGDRRTQMDGRPSERHLRSWWFVAAVSCCPIHELKLNDRCPECGQTTVLAGGRVTGCVCGADLSRSPRIRVPAAELAAEAYVVGRLGGIPRRTDPILDALPLGDAIDLMQRLGCCLAEGRDIRFGKLEPERRRSIMLAGFEALQGGDEGVERDIERLLEGPGQADRLWVQLGQLYSWFAKLPDGPLQGWLATRIANVVRRKQLRWQGWDRHVPSEPTPDRISASQAKACFGSGWKRTIAILEATGLRSDTEHLCRPTVDRSEVRAVAERIERLVDVTVLASNLGIDPSSARKLSASGIFPCDALARMVCRYPRYDQTEVARILVAMAGSAPLVGEPPVGSLSVPAASRLVGVVALCGGLLEGRIVPVANVVGRPGLQAIHVRSRGLADVVRSDDSPWIGLEESGRVLGYRRNGMDLLLRNGHMRTIKNARGIRLVHRGDVERFRKRYISTTELARSRGTSARALLATLAAEGRRPAIELAARGVVELRLFERSS